MKCVSFKYHESGQRNFHQVWNITLKISFEGLKESEAASRNETLIVIMCYPCAARSFGSSGASSRAGRRGAGMWLSWNGQRRVAAHTKSRFDWSDRNAVRTKARPPAWPPPLINSLAFICADAITPSPAPRRSGCHNAVAHCFHCNWKSLSP